MFLLEGFESEKNLPKIIASKTADEATEYFDGSVKAISGLIVKSNEEKAKAANFHVPILNSQTDITALADLLKKMPLNLGLANFDCYYASYPSLCVLVASYD